MEKFILKHTFNNISELTDENQYSSNTEFLECDWKICISSELTTEREYKLLSNKKEALVRKSNNYLYLKSNGRGYLKFNSWEDLFDEKNGYVNDDSITIEIHFNARKIKQDEDDMNSFLQSICKKITDSHTLEIKKQNDKISDLQKIQDEAKIIIDLVAQGKHIKTEENETETLEYIEKYEHVKQELEKFEGNANNTVDKKSILKLEDKIAICLAKLKMQNEDLEEQLKLTENLKARLENRVKIFRQQLENVIDAKEEEVEKKRQDIVNQLRNVETDLDAERKKNTQHEINNTKLENKLQDVEIELNNVKLKLENKEKLIKKLKDDLESQQTELKRVKNDLVSEQIQFKDVKNELETEKKKHALTKTELESKSQDSATELAKLKSDFEQKQKDIKAYLEKERMQHEDTKTAKKQLEFKVIEMERQLKNENSFKKLHKQLKEKLIKETNNEILITNLEEQIEVSEKKSLNYSKENRKLENELQEIKIYSEAEKRQIEQYQKELKDLKAELDKANEEINREKLEKEKTQRKYEDISDSLELLKQENKSFQTLKLRNLVKSTTSSFCEIDQEDSISIISTENEFEDDLNTQ